MIPLRTLQEQTNLDPPTFKLLEVPGWSNIIREKVVLRVLKSKREFLKKVTVACCDPSKNSSGAYRAGSTHFQILSINANFWYSDVIFCTC